MSSWTAGIDAWMLKSRNPVFPGTRPGNGGVPVQVVGTLKSVPQLKPKVL